WGACRRGSGDSGGDAGAGERDGVPRVQPEVVEDLGVQPDHAAAGVTGGRGEPSDERHGGVEHVATLSAAPVAVRTTAPRRLRVPLSPPRPHLDLAPAATGARPRTRRETATAVSAGAVPAAAGPARARRAAGRRGERHSGLRSSGGAGARRA